MLAVGGAVGFSLLQVPVYEASIKVLVGQEQTDEAPGQLGSDVQGLQQLTQTMELAVDSRPVAEDVIQRLDLDTMPGDFLGNLSAEQLGATQFIEVTYRDTDPEVAQSVANTTGETFSEEISQVNPSTDTITATVWERAPVPDSPVSPSFLRNILLGLAVGLLLGVALAFLVEYLDDSWRSPEEVELISGVAQKDKKGKS
jgi:capsular polysaccharide biosynthesis protein